MDVDLLGNLLADFHAVYLGGGMNDEWNRMGLPIHSPVFLGVPEMIPPTAA